MTYRDARYLFGKIWSISVWRWKSNFVAQLLRVFLSGQSNLKSYHKMQIVCRVLITVVCPKVEKKDQNHIMAFRDSQQASAVNSTLLCSDVQERPYWLAGWLSGRHRILYYFSLLLVINVYTKISNNKEYLLWGTRYKTTQFDSSFRSIQLILSNRPQSLKICKLNLWWMKTIG